jgi:hypothetical protein
MHGVINMLEKDYKKLSEETNELMSLLQVRIKALLKAQKKKLMSQYHFYRQRLKHFSRHRRIWLTNTSFCGRGVNGSRQQRGGSKNRCTKGL